MRAEAGLVPCAEPGKTGEARHVLVDLGVVLHRARSQRVETDVHGIVALGELRVVAHQIRLAHFRQGRRTGSPPMISASSRRRLISSGGSGQRNTNSWKVGPGKATSKPRMRRNRSRA